MTVRIARTLLLAMVLLSWMAGVPVAAQTPAPPPTAWNPGAGVEEVRVVFAGGERRQLTLEGRRLCDGAAVPYLSAADMASLVRAGRFWRDAGMSLRLSVGGREAVFTHGSRLVRLDARDVLLPTPPYAQDGDLWIPVTAGERVLAALTGEGVSWDPGSATLTVGGGRANVTSLRVETHGRSTLLKVGCSQALRWSLERPASDRLLLTLRGGVLERSLAEGVGGHGLVRSVRARQEDGRAVLEVSVLPLTSDAVTSSENGGRTIVIALAEAASGLPAPPVRGERSMGTPASLVQPPREVRRVVLDPGHGGDDNGVVVSSARREKDLMLDLARDVRDLLENAGFQVVLTRGGDDARGADERAERANTARGDVFLSLHAGGWFAGSRRGATAWVLPRDAAGGSGDFPDWETVQQQHLTESALLGETVLTRLSLDAGQTVRDLDRADLPVLRGVDMPAVLVEVGLLSNAEDEDLLSGGSDRRRLAAALANAVKAYRASVAERLGLAPAVEEER